MLSRKFNQMGQATTELLVLFPLIIMAIFSIYFCLSLASNQLTSAYRSHEYLVCIQNLEAISSCQLQATKGLRQNIILADSHPKASLITAHTYVQLVWQNSVWNTKQTITVQQPIRKD